MDPRAFLFFILFRIQLAIRYCMRRIRPTPVSTETTELLDMSFHPQMEVVEEKQEDQPPRVPGAYVDILRSRKRWGSSTTVYYIPDTVSVLIHHHPRPQHPTKDEFFVIPAKVVRCMEKRMQAEMQAAVNV